ncbi:phage protein, HK97 gp10 family [Vreelandella subterranea]|uniref:Phage protein, HK97 gp10 family n=1 Tax=Vreelandella subterranea TaxID=416874 RepID=A0A1H9UTY2_9GAMM|nr:HK97-gp10 family putative phage morphogenesis protein [Halomonas subterranea]SES12527.1 phage protein, HK97 gp10 family [Halomonas subterranea]
MSGFDWQAQGAELQEIQRDLRDLEDNLKERAIRAGLVSVVSPVKKTAKSEAPTESGDMAQAIGHRNINKRQRSRLGFKAGEVGILVGTNRRINGIWQGRKGMWQEHGTENMDANPFLWPAMQQHQSGAPGRFYEGLAKYLDRQRSKGAIA